MTVVVTDARASGMSSGGGAARAGDRWEAGSAFPLMLPSGPAPVPLPRHARLFGSGRQALRALVEFGRREHRWEAVHVPTYYCPSVVDALADLLPVRRYDAGPAGPLPRPDAGPRDVVIAVSYFGEPPALPSTAATLVVDVTHDPIAPWLDRTGADYLFASLRKTLPVPDGGMLWSAGGQDLPAAVPPAEAHLAEVGRFLSAMCLKAAYLDGAPVRKDQYLPLYAAGEAGLGARTVSGISDFSRAALRILPAADLRRRRVAGAAALAADLGGLCGATAHPHPFGVVLECDTPERRESVRRGLVARNVYPAVLWDLSPEQAPPHQVDLSRRMLHLHTDVRHGRDDLRRVAGIVRALCAPAEARPVPATSG